MSFYSDSLSISEDTLRQVWLHMSQPLPVHLRLPCLGRCVYAKAYNRICSGNLCSPKVKCVVQNLPEGLWELCAEAVGYNKSWIGYYDNLLLSKSSRTKISEALGNARNEPGIKKMAALLCCRLLQIVIHSSWPREKYEGFSTQHLQIWRLMLMLHWAIAKILKGAFKRLFNGHAPLTGGFRKIYDPLSEQAMCKMALTQW